MSRYVIVLASATDRERAKRYVDAAPYGTRIEFKAIKRSTDQNSRMWAMLSDIAEQLPWHGQKLRPDDYKLIFMAALKRELRLVPNIDGDGFVNLGTSSSDLSKSEMGDLMTLIEMFAAQHGVKLNDPQAAA